MDYMSYIKAGTPVIVRSYTSGVVCGRIQGGERGSVVLSDWRWIRRWEGVGGEGSVYDLIHSGKAPTRRGPLAEETTILQQADVMEISEEAYKRIAHD